MINFFTQTAKGVAVAGGSYYIIHTQLTNRTAHLSSALHDLSVQYNILSFSSFGPEESIAQASFRPRPAPFVEQIKSNWNQSLQALHSNIYGFDFTGTCSRTYEFLQSRLSSASTTSPPTTSNAS
ncbi:hypothetical protein CROQUDRAFT_725419 [Cronartium quercuum f. sp. fusiforme G11]|uniref:Uncharacterized protein n=1 Tax=Cronartium quercuum f. sp. fusiforme G11 TaxID=708437 RepID=A0A9P6NDW7_9BASI|nr:hypothetical protein CROQUDRAFT_725419 [Cronartium quercuum f. sp. fusiforme G11]